MRKLDWLLLAVLIVGWGMTWPVMKLAVNGFPPLTFRLLAIMGALPLLWLFARRGGGSLAVPAGGVWRLIALSIPNMVVWHTFVILGVKMLPSGRAAVLGYTMPSWALLSGALFWGERVSRLSWVGVALVVAATLLLISSEWTSMSGRPLGCALVLFAAASWGHGTVLLKRTKLEMSTAALTFWMLTITAITLLFAAFMLERHAWRVPTFPESVAIAYNIVVAFGICYPIWFRLARILPPVVSGLSLAICPVIGVLTGGWLFGERLSWQDYVASVLELGATATVLYRHRGTGFPR